MPIPFAFLTHHQQLKTRLPVIPHTLFGGGEESSSWGAPRIWERHAYDTRFVSITTMNLNVPHNVFDSITGIEIEVGMCTHDRQRKGRKIYLFARASLTTRTVPMTHTHTHTQRFYRARQGAGWDRRFTIVSGLTQAGVDACGMLDRDSEIWLNWSDGDDASLHQFRWVGQCRVCVGGGSVDTPVHNLIT